jgi:hypothetical protein
VRGRHRLARARHRRRQGRPGGADRIAALDRHLAPAHRPLGHSLGATPKGRLFPTTRDQLVELAALVRAIAAGRLDALCLRDAPLDILAQQVVAMAACEELAEEEIFALVRRAAQYASSTAASSTR